jgi:hypothetical protein
MLDFVKRPVAPTTYAPAATEIGFRSSVPVRKVGFGFSVHAESLLFDAFAALKTARFEPSHFLRPSAQALTVDSYRFLRPAISRGVFGVLAATSRRVELTPRLAVLCAIAEVVQQRHREVQGSDTAFEQPHLTKPILRWALTLTSVDTIGPPPTHNARENDVRKFAGCARKVTSLALLQQPTLTACPTSLAHALSDWQALFLLKSNTRNVNTHFTHSGTAQAPMQLASPRTRGRVFVRFAPAPLLHAGERSRKEASRQRSPDDDPFATLFYLLLAQQNWDVRVKGLDALLAAYPESKRPFGFQFEGIKFLASRTKALLADEMGLGKTVQAILAMRARIHAGMVQRVLVACPKSLLPTWYHEISIWAPELSVTVVHGPEKARAISRKHHVYITNFETVARLICDERGIQKEVFRPFDLLIIDEIQFLKNPSAKKSIAVAGVNASQRWGLTGTPLENSFCDYRHVWRIINPGMKLTPLSDSELLSVTKCDVLRREKSAVLKDLPNKMYRIQLVELEGAQLERYRELESAARRDVATKLGMKPNDLRMHVLALLTALKQQCIYDEGSGTSAKLEWIHQMLQEMHPVGVDSSHCEKALVFTQYSNLVCDKWNMLKSLRQFRPLRYDGTLSEQDRIHFSSVFQTDERHRVAFVSLKAGGTGLTLTRANQVVFLDQWWNPAVMEQAAGRVHRIGQTRMCLITSLVAKSTVDERILIILARKQKLFESVMAEIREGRRSPDDLSKLENALTLDEMLEALGLSRGRASQNPR